MTKENKCPNCGYDLNKKRYDWTTEEIIEAMKRICPEAWEENEHTSGE
jgi:hypothetical protein